MVADELVRPLTVVLEITGFAGAAVVMKVEFVEVADVPAELADTTSKS
jgi:hypothetical protein